MPALAQEEEQVILNPFTLQIAQGIAQIKPVSGWEYRVVVWAIVTGFAIAWVMVYAAKIKKDPKRSSMYELDKKRKEEIKKRIEKAANFNVRHALCLTVLGLTIVAMIYGVVALDWFIVELGALFFAMGITCGLIGGMGPNQLAKAFIAGIKDMAGAALVV